MSRNISGIYSLPAGSIVTTGDTILAASHNDPLNDIATDMNTARPIVAGGTGADSAAGALVNLGLTATAAELNTLDGITATVAELNILDGVTATAAELNILDGVTATAAELNVLDGITATVTELNYTDGVTSAIQTQLNAKAPTASPTFTGTPAAPTATTGTSTTQIATTAFVNAEISGDVGVANSSLVKTAVNAAGSAPIYACRAWVNFDGGFASIRAAGNVSSITDNGTGNFTVNFTTAMQDASYSVVAVGNDNTGDATFRSVNLGLSTNIVTTSCQIFSKAVNQSTSQFEDLSTICVSVFR